MKKMNFKKLFNFKALKNNRGQGATEYILLVAVVVGLVMMFGPKIKEKLNQTTDTLGNNIQSTVDSAVK